MNNTLKKLLLLSTLILVLLIISSCKPIPKNCKSLEGSNKDNCIIQEAVTQKNADFCKVFKEDSLNNWCFHDVALETTNLETCNNIFNEESIDYCKRDIILKQNNSDACSELSGLAMNDCFIEFANKRLNWTLCEQAKDYDLRDNCLAKIAEKTTNPEPCSKISNNNIEQRNNCLYQQSIKTNQNDYCELITNIDNKELCIATIAVNTDNLELCDSLTTGAKNICKQKFPPLKSQ